MWPWIIKYPKRWWITLSLFLVGTVALLYLNLPDAAAAARARIIGTFIGQFRIQIMAVGGLFAYLVFKEKHKILAVLYRRDLQLGVYILTGSLIASGIHFQGFMEVYSILFGYVILNLATNPNSLVNIEGRFMRYSGKISYGLYLYHVAVLVLLINLLEPY